MKKKERLIIFYKNPELGKVKTRLAATVGDEMALAVYLRLASHTRQITSLLSVDLVVYYSEMLDFEDEWKTAKALQNSHDLGARMSQAFEESFALGYERVCIIGTDCWELQAHHLNEAFDKLRVHDVIIGPAADGGYYLLGMTRLHTSFFYNKVWSSTSVLADTLKEVKALNLRYGLLPTLRDVDEEKDLPENWREEL